MKKKVKTKCNDKNTCIKLFQNTVKKLYEKGVPATPKEATRI